MKIALVTTPFVKINLLFISSRPNRMGAYAIAPLVKKAHIPDKIVATPNMEAFPAC